MTQHRGYEGIGSENGKEKMDPDRSQDVDHLGFGDHLDVQLGKMRKQLKANSRFPGNAINQSSPQQLEGEMGVHGSLYDVAKHNSSFLF